MGEWKIYRLGDICKNIIDYRGKTPAKLGADWAKSGYRVLSAKNIKTGNIVQTNSIRYVDENLYKKWMKDEIERGDIIITSEAPFGEIYYWDSDEKIVLGQRLFGLKINEICYSKYLYYYMTTAQFQSELKNRATGTTVIGLRQPELLKCTVNLPSLDEQRRIAGILGSLDDKIELNRQINANLEAQAQALFRSWFVDFEPFRNGSFVDSELGKIPQGWKVETLSNLATVIKKGITPSNSETYSHYSIPAYDDAHFPERQSGETIKSGKYIVYNNSILLSKLNPRIKRLWFIKTAEENAICSTEFIPIQTKDTDLISFVYYLIDNDIFYQQALSLVNGATGSHQRFHAEDIMQIPFAWNKDAAINFAQKANCILQKIEDNIKENQTLSTLRDTLLPKLMAGEIAIE